MQFNISLFSYFYCLNLLKYLKYSKSIFSDRKSKGTPENMPTYNVLECVNNFIIYDQLILHWCLLKNKYIILVAENIISKTKKQNKQHDTFVDAARVRGFRKYVIKIKLYYYVAIKCSININY